MNPKVVFAILLFSLAGLLLIPPTAGPSSTPSTSIDDVVTDSQLDVVRIQVTLLLSHCECGEGLWLQVFAASQTRSFRDAEPQQVIPPNAKKIMDYFQSS